MGTIAVVFTVRSKYTKSDEDSKCVVPFILLYLVVQNKRGSAGMYTKIPRRSQEFRR